MKADWKDDIFEGEHRKYNLIENEDGTVSLQDATDYTQQGDAFGAKELNAIAAEVNETKKSVSDGKTLIAAAITEKKVKTAADATFAVMAENIGKIICGSGTATPADVLKGVTFTGNDGIEKTGTLDVQSILSFSAAPYSDTQITFTWKNPAKGAFSGVIIVGKTGSYPTSVNDGTRYYKGIGNNSSPNGTSTQVVSGFTQGTTYYFRAFAYAVKNSAEWVCSSSLTATATTKAKGTKTFTSSGTFTVPANVTSIDIFCVGAGGSGGPGYEDSYNDGDDVGYYNASAGGGGGGYTATKKAYTVTPGQTFTVTIGAGTNGEAGGDTSFGSVLTAKGGESGTVGGYMCRGGHGGSGGGAIYYHARLNEIRARVDGASDGGSTELDGYGSSYRANGQGTTTRAFGESSNTLYSGGGAAFSDGGSTNPGSGGGGNAGGKGSANTGGGGGGGRYRSLGSSTIRGGAGGSGICIVRWGY